MSPWLACEQAFGLVERGTIFFFPKQRACSQATPRPLKEVPKKDVGAHHADMQMT